MNFFKKHPLSFILLIILIISSIIGIYLTVAFGFKVQAIKKHLAILQKKQYQLQSSHPSPTEENLKIALSNIQKSEKLKTPWAKTISPDDPLTLNFELGFFANNLKQQAKEHNILIHPECIPQLSPSSYNECQALQHLIDLLYQAKPSAIISIEQISSEAKAYTFTFTFIGNTSAACNFIGNLETFQTPAFVKTFEVTRPDQNLKTDFLEKIPDNKTLALFIVTLKFFDFS